MQNNTTHKQELHCEYLSRTEGLVSAAIRDKVVLAVGTGAGSYMLEKLVRCASPAEMRLLDFDRVEWVNLCRTSFGASDVGNFKAEALARRIEDANPFVRVVPHAVDLCALGDADLTALCAGVDLIIAGTDSFPAQALLNRLSQRYNIPTVFIGIHAGAQGGRVIWSLPGETACYRCVAAERYTQFDHAGAVNTDLRGAHGVLPDIQFIDMVALKITLALLDRGQNSAMGRFYAAMNGRNEVVVRCAPDYEYGTQLWDALLSDLPTEPKPFAEEIKEQILFAMDTIWLQTERVASCPDCGENGARVARAAN